MNGEFRVVEINGHFAIVKGHTLINVSFDRNGGLYETKEDAAADMHYQAKLERLRRR